ncbi:hypothetical protein ACTMSW_05860 [Micromonospora sp. BQ11]|uniref:hypothetical protein n=1 Tax=Micromonospora sp. BQ11 TaxID=3452212 RepID=UPI003F8A0E34
MDTTIKVDALVRDRLAVLARERGLTMRELVAELARATPTDDELRERASRAEEYVRQHLAPHLTETDLAVATDTWTAIEAGETPEVLPRSTPGRAA